MLSSAVDVFHFVYLSFCFVFYYYRRRVNVVCCPLDVFFWDDIANPFVFWGKAVDRRRFFVVWWFPRQRRAIGHFARFLPVAVFCNQVRFFGVFFQLIGGKAWWFCLVTRLARRRTRVCVVLFIETAPFCD